MNKKNFCFIDTETDETKKARNYINDLCKGFYILSFTMFFFGILEALNIPTLQDVPDEEFFPGLSKQYPFGFYTVAILFALCAYWLQKTYSKLPAIILCILSIIAGIYSTEWTLQYGDPFSRAARLGVILSILLALGSFGALYAAVTAKGK